MGRWCKTCKERSEDNFSVKAKVFQVLFFMFIGITELVYSSWALLYLNYYYRPIFGYYVGGVMLEYVVPFLSRCVTYGMLANNWEGY